MTLYETLSDDFYINLNLNTEMELKSTRENVLHYFEQVQKKYSSMRNFYSRDLGEYVLEEDKVGGMYRWATVEPRRICSGYVNPRSLEDVMQQHALVLGIAPYALSLQTTTTRLRFSLTAVVNSASPPIMKPPSPVTSITV